MGKRRVGFLSGGPYDATDFQGEPNKRARNGRIVFGLSGLVFIVFAFLLIFLGVANLETTTSELEEGAKVSETWSVVL
jgi:energy-converting hydrogenase Eha subunit H